MPECVLVVRHVDSAQPQWATVCEAMGVVANANACRVRGYLPVSVE